MVKANEYGAVSERDDRKVPSRSSLDIQHPYSGYIFMRYIMVCLMDSVTLWNTT